MNETNNEAKQVVSGDKIVDIITALKFKLDTTNEQVINLSMLVEYLFIQLENQNIKIDMEAFPTWAEEKYKELEEVAKRIAADGLDKEIKEHLEEQKKHINLME
jgi:flagellin-specific chaperone FliS